MSQRPSDTIYAIRVGQYVKIGISIDVEKRLRSYERHAHGTQYPADLDLAAPVELVGVLPRATLAVERAIHDAFFEYRVVGEWFAWNPTIAEWCRRRDQVDYGRVPLDEVVF